MTTMYTRLMPESEGGKCKRLTISGQTFMAGRWYRMNDRSLQMVRPLMQARGIPYFQVLTEKEWRETTRKELAAAMAGQLGGDAIAALQGLVGGPQVSSSPKTGPTKSSFEGLEADELGAGEGISKATSDVGVDDGDEDLDADVADGPDPDADTGPDIDGLRTKKDAVALGEDYGIELDPDAKLSEMKDRLTAEIYGDE